MGKRMLIPLQAKILRLLSKHSDDPLTYRDFAREVDVASTNTIAYHLHQLEKKGFIKRDPYSPKNYLVMGTPEPGIVRLNLYGLVHCGPTGSLLEGEPIDRIPVATRLIPFPAMEAFLVKAKGDSMEPRIYEGDLVLAKRQCVANSGDIVVCVNQGESLIKRIKKDSGGAILISLNTKYEPFFASKEDFRIAGVVRAIISRTVN